MADEIQSRIEALRKRVDDDAITELLDIVEEVHSKSRTTDSVPKTGEESQSLHTGEVRLSGDVFDETDQTVVDSLVVDGEATVTIEQLAECYVRETDIEDTVTARGRGKNLLTHGPFSPSESQDRTFKFQPNRDQIA